MKKSLLCLMFICIFGQAFALDLNGTWYTGSKSGTPSLSDPASNSFIWGTDDNLGPLTSQKGTLWSYFPEMTLANDGEAITLSFTVTPLDATATGNSLRFGLYNDGDSRVLNNLSGVNEDNGFLSTLGYYARWNATPEYGLLVARTAGDANPCGTTGATNLTVTESGPDVILTQGTAYDMTLTVTRNSAAEYLVSASVDDGTSVTLTEATTTTITATEFNTFFLLNTGTGIDSFEFANMQVKKILPPDPANGETLVEIDLSSRDVPGNLSWPAPEYAGATYDIYFGTTEPNFNDPAPYGLTQIGTAGQAAISAAPSLPLTNEVTYYWVVDSYEPNLVGTEIPILHQGGDWTFTTIPADFSPVVDAGDSYVTWLANLPQALSGTVGDSGEGDVADADVVWSITGYPGDPVNAVAQMYDRLVSHPVETQGNIDELEVLGHDPNFLKDWIGTDARVSGDPLVLTLSGLASSTPYTWTSTHHDAKDQTGLFDVTVDGVSAGIGIDISDNNSVPTTFTTSITTNGTGDPVKLVFSQQVSDPLIEAFFVMNGFELTDGTNPALKVDFGPVGDNTAVGFQAYTAEQEVLSTFTPQAFTALGTTVTVLPEWGPLAAGLITASVTKTSTNPLAPTATFTTNYAGDYTIQLTATDEAANTDSDTLVVRAAADACAAAQLAPSWPGFSDYDDLGNQNCIVDLPDFAALALEWLDDINLTASEAF